MELTQKQFIRNCYDYYRESGLTPGNPDDGVWHEAHYPLPRGRGSRWVYLLEEHHAVQAVLQSEEVGHPCVWSWEGRFLVGDWEHLLPLFDKWMSIRGSLGGQASVALFTEAELSERGRRAGRANKGSPKREGHKTGSAPASEKQKQSAKESAERLHRDRYRCTVTHKESTWTGLINYQRARGIDTSNRIKINLEQCKSLD